MAAVEHHPFDARSASAGADHQALDLAFDDLEPRLGMEQPTHHRGVDVTVAEDAGRLNRRALRCVEGDEVRSSLVGRPAHRPTQCVELSHQVAFRRAANGRIAAHHRDAVVAERDPGGAEAHASTGEGGLAARMPKTHDDDVVPHPAHISLEPINGRDGCSTRNLNLGPHSLNPASDNGGARLTPRLVARRSQRGTPERSCRSGSLPPSRPFRALGKAPGC